MKKLIRRIKDVISVIFTGETQETILTNSLYQYVHDLEEFGADDEELRNLYLANINGLIQQLENL